MLRTLVAAVVIAGCVAVGATAAGDPLTGVALAAIDPALGSPAPKYDRVTGNGQRAFFPGLAGYTPIFTIDVRSGPSGENVKGTMTIDWGTSWLDGPFNGTPYSTTVNVTNLCVTGNTATIVGIITSGTNANVGDALLTVVHDGGKGGKSDWMLGVFSGDFYVDKTKLSLLCNDPYPPEPEGVEYLLPLISGNINVTDATP